MEPPVILVTASNPRAAARYCHCLETRNARVRLALPGQPLPPANPMPEISGLLLTGGEDVDPTFYGETADPAAGVETNHARDETELALLRHALDQDLPVLAICRGFQLLNVALGGRLIQDLANHRGPQGEGSIYHQIYLSPGSKLAAILGSGGFIRVNSRHHQGLKERHRSSILLASAYSLGDGLIEGLESPNHDWVIGVQSHPELEEEVPKSFGRLFQAFIQRAEMAAARRASQPSG